MNGQTFRVLLVGDRGQAGKTIRPLLDGPFRLDCIDAPLGAIPPLAAAPADVILLDATTAGEPPWNLARRIPKRMPSTPVVILGRRADEQRAARALREGFQDFLALEHLSTNLLQRSLRHAIERTRVRARLMDHCESLREQLQARTAELHSTTAQLRSEIEARKEAEESAHRLEGIDRRADRLQALSELASGITHELHHPLTAILAFASSCIEGVRSAAWTRDQLLDVLEKTSEQAARAGDIVKRVRSLLDVRDTTHTMADETAFRAWIARAGSSGPESGAPPAAHGQRGMPRDRFASFHERGTRGRRAAAAPSQSVALRFSGSAMNLPFPAAPREFAVTEPFASSKTTKDDRADTKSEPTVFLLDPNPDVREGIRCMLAAAGLAVQAFTTTGKLLAALGAGARGCLLAEVRMPDIDGIQLQGLLAERGISVPVILMTDEADVSSAVEGMKAGAIDYLEQPLEPGDLLPTIHNALALDAQQHERCAASRAAKERMQALTAREREVLDGLIDRKTIKQIAGELGTSPHTVRNQRKSILRKLEARTDADLVRLVLACDAPFPDVRLAVLSET